MPCACIGKDSTPHHTGKTLHHFLGVIVSYAQVMSGPMFIRVNAIVIKCQCPTNVPLEVVHPREA